MSDVLRVLTEARELISDESRWTQKELARETSGAACEATSADAVCWCAEGAVRRALKITENVYSEEFGGIWGALNRASGRKNPITVNDHFGHDAVLAMFDVAIATEQAKVGAAS